MNVLTIALVCFAALGLAYRFYGRFIVGRVYGAGDFPDERVPSRAREDGQDFVPTPRAVLLGHHYVTIAGAGPIVGPAVAVTWGWFPALAWILFGAIFIGAVHDVGSLLVSLRNRGRTIGDLAADILTPRVRLLFLAFIFVALWVVLAVFAFVIAGLFSAIPESVLAIWVEIPIAMAVGWWVFRRGGSMLLWSLAALVLMYAAIGLGMTPAVVGLFSGAGLMFWLVALFVYSYLASVLPVTRLLQPRDTINAHQLFFALALLVIGILTAPFTRPETLEVVAPAVNGSLPEGTPLLYPFLFITIACGAISGFHCMVASGTTARQISTERDARAIGYGAMILEGGLAVIVVLCCVAAAGFADVGAWDAKYSTAWVGGAGFTAKLEGVIRGGAAFIDGALSLIGLGGVLTRYLEVVLTVVIVSFAATTMDSATRIQRYVVAEIGNAIRRPALGRKHVATGIAVFSAAALALGAGAGGSGGLVLWPVFGVVNQLLACLTFLVLNTWLAKRGRPIIYTTVPMLFLIVTVSWAAIRQLMTYAADPAAHWHLIAVLSVGLVLEAWMLFEAFAAFRVARQARRGESPSPTSRIGADGVIRGPDAPEIPAGSAS